MRDIFDDARETLAEITALRHQQTHYAGCRRVHTGCLIAAMIREIERLRLTDAEAEAIESAIKWIEYPDPENENMIYGYKATVAILRDVLRRCS